MIISSRALFVLPLIFAIAGCTATNQSARVAQAPVMTASIAPDPTLAQPTPAQATASARAMTDVTGFIDASAVVSLTANDRSQAANAQFNALQFGRAGAPRSWQGDAGTTGRVTVGPIVRVNNLDCRDFTHTVTLGGKASARKGTACREPDGSWAVVEATSVG